MSEGASRSVSQAQDRLAEELPVEFCPVCSARLQSRQCKMILPRCGYFMSCSEFE